MPFDFGDEEVNALEMVSASCTVNKGDLKDIDIYWKFNGLKLFTNNGVLVSRSSPRISVLSIESVRGRHSGNYTCVAENAAGLAHHTATLSIKGCVTFLSFLFFI